MIYASLISLSSTSIMNAVVTTLLDNLHLSADMAECKRIIQSIKSELVIEENSHREHLKNLYDDFYKKELAAVYHSVGNKLTAQEAKSIKAEEAMIVERVTAQHCAMMRSLRQSLASQRNTRNQIYTRLRQNNFIRPAPKNV